MRFVHDAAREIAGVIEDFTVVVVKSTVPIGNSVGVTGNLAITGGGRVDLDPYFLGGSGGGSSLTVGGTLTNSSTNCKALDIGYTNIGAGDTVTAGRTCQH